MSIFLEGLPGLTWAAARQKVRGDLWRPGNSLPDDVVDRALHASVLELEAETKWVWLENLTTVFSLAESASFIDLPPTVSRVSSVSVRRLSSLDQLDERPLAIVRSDMGLGTGAPSAWAQGEGRIWFDLRVPSDMAFEALFTASTPEVLEDAIVSPSFTLARQQQAIIANACHYVALGFMKNEAEAARQRAVYDRIVERLHSVEADRRGGAVQPDTWGMACG